MHWKGNYTQSDLICIQNLDYCQELHVCIQKIGPQRHKPFLLLPNHFLLLQQEMEYIGVLFEEMLLSENEDGEIRSECSPVPTLTTSLPVGRMKISTPQGLLSILSQPPAKYGSVTFRVKERILVFNSLDYSLINRLLLQIKILMQHKPIPFAYICPYQYSIWWANMPQWADSLFCLCIAQGAVSGERGVQTRVSQLHLQSVSIKNSASTARCQSQVIAMPSANLLMAHL